MKLFKRKNKDQSLTEKEVLNSLGISDFKCMDKDKVKDFTALIPQMQPEVTKAALGQFPNFAQMSMEVVTCYKDLMGQMMADNSVSTQSFYQSCDLILDSLSEIINKKRIRFKQKKLIIDNMMQILQIKNEKDSENKAWFVDIAKTVSAAAVAIVGIVGTIIGVKISKN